MTLPCDSSLVFFPGNTIAKYNTKLLERICLDGVYEVALVEIIYPQSLNNIHNKDESLYIQVFMNQKVILHYTVESAYYKNESSFAKALTDDLNAKLDGLSGIKAINVNFTFDEKSRRIKLTVQCDPGIILFLSENLKTKLGFCKEGPYTKGWVLANESFDIRAGQQLMYVYCDVANFVPVGNTKSPLLRVCNVTGSYGEIVRVTFDRPFYVPVSKQEFDTVLIDIRD